MNLLLRSVLLTACLGLLAGAARAEPVFKPLIVDMNKVFDGHYKTEEVTTKLNEIGLKIQEHLDQMNKQVQEQAEQFNQLLEKSRDTLLKPEARTQAENEAQKLAEKIQGMQNEMQQFRAQQQEKLKRAFNNHRDILLEEINAIVKNIAVAKGATVVFDKSISPMSGISGIVYNDASYDISEEVLKEANKDRPPPPPPAPAPATTPAADPAAATPPPAPAK